MSKGNDVSTKNLGKTKTFPRDAVVSVLTDELLSTVEQHAKLHGVKLADTQAGVLKQAIEIDSLVVVDVICTVDPIVGFELPERVVRQGGYQSVSAAVTHLTTGIERLWQKRNKS